MGLLGWLGSQPARSCLPVPLGELSGLKLTSLGSGRQPDPSLLYLVPLLPLLPPLEAGVRPDIEKICRFPHNLCGGPTSFPSPSEPSRGLLPDTDPPPSERSSSGPSPSLPCAVLSPDRQRDLPLPPEAPSTPSPYNPFPSFPFPLSECGTPGRGLLLPPLLQRKLGEGRMPQPCNLGAQSWLQWRHVIAEPELGHRPCRLGPGFGTLVCSLKDCGVIYPSEPLGRLAKVEL